MKKILIIQGHPSDKNECLNFKLAKAYESALQGEQAEYKKINIGELVFDPVLRDGYRTIQPLEPGLLEAQKMILWADHVTLFFPVWWGQMPGKLKGFFDRALLPGFGFKKKSNGGFTKLLTGRSATVYCTMGLSRFLYRLVFFNAIRRIVKYSVLGFCGFNPVKIKIIGQAENCHIPKVAKILKAVHRQAIKDLKK